MDFAHVADDESRHLGWCFQRLEELGYAYGDMPAHNMLWEGAQKSSGVTHCLQMQLLMHLVQRTHFDQQFRLVV